MPRMVRRGASVAAAMKHSKKKSGKGGKKHPPNSSRSHKSNASHVKDDPLNDFLHTDPRDVEKTFGKRAAILQSIIASKNHDGKVVLGAPDRNDIIQQRRIDGMYHLVEARLERNSNYVSAFCLIVFFTVSIAVLVQQRDIATAYSVEGTVFNSVNGDLNLKTMEITRSDEFYDWLEGLIGKVFSDPACGDGVCETPDEFPGFGRFGCIPDCGRYKKTTKVKVQLEDFFEYSKSQIGDFHPDNKKSSNWDMSGVIDKQKDIHPGYKWNIWSDTVGDYIFAEHQNTTNSGTPSVPVDLPDGRCELRLFQTRKVSEEIDVGTIFDQLYLLPSTLPKRTAKTDYAYGDKYEAMASAAIIMKQMNDYCFGGALDKTPQKCTEIPTVDTMFKTLGRYGLTGKIAMPDPSSTAKPPIPKTLVMVDFCGLMKNGTQGLKNRYNKLFYQEVGIDCGNRRNLAMLSSRGLEANLSTSAQVDRKLLDGLSKRYGTCTQHGDCDQTVVDEITGFAGQFCHRKWGCDTCSFCQVDGADAINGLCPKAYCPESGELPGCVSAGRLTPDHQWSCPAKAEFEIWRYHRLTKETLLGKETPKVVPPGQPKVRHITPHNRLVGPFMITQYRRKTGNCSKVVNPFIKAWAQQGLEDGDGCLQGEDEFDNRFFGTDPAFVPTTQLYDGNLVVEEYYELNERLNKTISESTARGITTVTLPDVPMAFYPYKYDLYNHTFKDTKAPYYDSEMADHFKVYFDLQISMSQAENMLSFMKDGGFIDESTSTIDVQFIAFNPELNRFVVCQYTFEWTEGGSISWSYWVESVSLDVYKLQTGKTQMAFEIIICIMFGLNVLLELQDIFVSMRSNKVLDYFQKVGNLFDWLHFIFMGLSIYLWLRCQTMCASITMEKDAYPVLVDPYAGARVFTVDIGKEAVYHRFRRQLEDTANMFRLYNAFSGTAVVLFVFRILKALDFQPMMGIVTRTLTGCSSDMLHFIVLFVLITFGYACSGVLLFGHQFSDFDSVGHAFMKLIDIVLVFDSTAFYEQMLHACNEGAMLIYIWSWIFVGFFLLLNIFLAIVIDAYIAAKTNLVSKLGMHEEVGSMLVDFYNSCTLPKTKYMTDATLFTILQEHKMGLPTTSQIREAVLESLKEEPGIVFEEGIYINKHSMRRILRGPAEVESLGAVVGGNKDADEEPAPGTLQDSSDDEEEVNWRDLEEETVVEDLMTRYEAGHRGEEAMILEAMRVDGMKRSLSLFRHQQWVFKSLKHSAEVCERLSDRIVPASKQALIAKQAAALNPRPTANLQQSQGLLRVTIIEAQNLPKMDLMRTTDAYCLIFLTDSSGDLGEIIYRTQTVPRNLNPVWNEEFLFSLYMDVEHVSILMYDEDSITDDDLIGSAQIELNSLEPWVPTERWLQLQNTAREDQGIKLSKVRVQMTLQPANAGHDNDSFPEDAIGKPRESLPAATRTRVAVLSEDIAEGKHPFSVHPDQ